VATGLLVYDLVDAPFAAKRANRETSRSIALAPWATPDPEGATTGLAVVGTF
jgi:hypothetical protein